MMKTIDNIYVSRFCKPKNMLKTCRSDCRLACQ